MSINIQNEFLAYRILDDEGNGLGFSVVVEDMDKLNKVVKKVTDYKDGDEFLNLYDEDQGTQVYFELMAINGIVEHIGWVEIVDGQYMDQ